MNYISNKNIKCKAVLYDGNTEEFVKQVMDNLNIKFFVERFESPIYKSFDIYIMDINTAESTCLSIRNNHYLVQMEDQSIGVQGCVLIEKEVFEFLFKEV